MAETPPVEKSFRQWAPHLLPLLRPFRGQLLWALGAMVLDALLTAFRPWPLKVVIDSVLTHKATRVPWIGNWLNHASLEPMHIVYGACAATLLIAASTEFVRHDAGMHDGLSTTATGRKQTAPVPATQEIAVSFQLSLLRLRRKTRIHTATKTSISAIITKDTAAPWPNSQ